MNHTASFDVFDTLLTRRVGTPTSLFVVIGLRAVEAGIIEISPIAFREQRVTAEAEARKKAPGAEVTLDEIYASFSEIVGITPAAAEAMTRLELSVEEEYIVPVPGSLEMVATSRRQSVNVLFVSDMYLPASFIRAQLEKYGFWTSGDHLYVSGERRVSKEDGSMYRVLLEREALRPFLLHHVGDNKDSDFKMPESMGIDAKLTSSCSLLHYEKMLEEYSDASVGFSSILAGTSRITRLQKTHSNAHHATLSDIACSLICPVVALYSTWLLAEATKRGLTRLYFVARDGYVIKHITDALIRVFRLQLETRYLYGSRQAWHVPAITGCSEESMSWLFERTRTLTLRIVLRRLEICPENISSILEPLGWSKAKWDQPLDAKLLLQLKTDLQQPVRLLLSKTSHR